ncbi:MAG: protein kinase, partial [Pseudolysinimonas sp.]
MTWEQTAPAAEERTIAGHRVLRLLARGERSRVWLAADERVLKVLATPWAPNQPMAEVEALHRARGDHVIELLDVAIDETQAVLVFPRLARGSLADVLMSRAGFDAGEAVTALAPLAVTLARMHGAGVSHGSVSASNVLFRVDAAPMLIGFGGASLFESGLPEVRRERVPGVIADRAALASLAEAVLGRVTGPRSAAAAALAATLSPGSSQLDLEARLARELFELAAARPIALERPQGDAGIPRAVGVIAL